MDILGNCAYHHNSAAAYAPSGLRSFLAAIGAARRER